MWKWWQDVPYRHYCVQEVWFEGLESYDKLDCVDCRREARLQVLTDIRWVERIKATQPSVFRVGSNVRAMPKRKP